MKQEQRPEWQRGLPRGMLDELDNKEAGNEPSRPGVFASDHAPTMRTTWWQDETTDENGVRSRALMFYGAVFGIIIQFPENAPTTYAHVKRNRIGPFSSWEEAQRAVLARAAQG